MSATTPKFSSYPGFGESAKKSSHYSTAVLLPAGPTIHISGQGGWATSASDGPDIIPADFATEVANAFTNVDVALKNAGGKGMEQVYKLVVYLAPGMNYPVAEEGIKLLRQWFKDEDKLPLLTVVGVQALYLPTMHIEVEASAFLG